MAKQGKDIIKGTFPVLGMSCAACAGSAENIITQQEGVLNASVNFATGNLSVDYRPTITSCEKLQQALQSVGFDLLLEDESIQQDTLEALHAAKFQQLKTKTFWAIILSIPVVIIGMFFMNIPYANVFLFVFSSPVVVWLGRVFFVGAW